ncbi:hypothetical protein EAH57_12975 [Acinetobacter sp. 2JN-4]|uniref:oligosaccharide repeat unit polymerase n=1 Tax=Acinetobacter sp. 2JN-4 TaxID=2479844 RepID=UPI000EF99BE2|nr:oligosaccharide repeat unit polymerase [Acinetobacter sp. 2JN-4]RLZ07470.1 hypothetical protein EAH57_12975 [Acinetobacter sp. 2JN-4]
MLYEILILSLLTISILFINFYLLRDTIFGISFSRKNYNGILLAREFIIVITFGVWVVYILGLNNIPTFFVKQESLFLSSIIILSTFNAFLISVLFFSRYFFRNYFILHDNKLNFRNGKFVLTIFSLNLFACVLLIHFLGAKHAIINSIITGSNLLDVRMENRYSSNIPTVIASYLKFLYIMCSALLAVNFKNKGVSVGQKFFVISLVCYASSLYGGKAPLFNCLLIFLFGYMCSIDKKIDVIKFLKFTVPILVFGIGIIYYLTKIQFSELKSSEVVEYILLRVSTGQMMGVYEQLDFKLRGFDYIWRSVPFANMFFDYKEYSKDLMMNTWGSYKDASEVGVMNSYFIGEAYAIGGVLFMLVSPFVFGLNYCISIFLLIFLLHRVFGLDKTFSIKTVGLSIAFLFPLTGDIAGMVFLKQIVMYIVFLIPLIFVVEVFRSNKG